MTAETWTEYGLMRPDGTVMRDSLFTYREVVKMARGSIDPPLTPVQRVVIAGPWREPKAS